MREALPAIASLVTKIAAGVPVGTPEEDGYFPRGIRVNYFESERGSKRAVQMLVRKIRGEPFRSEYPMPVFDRVEPSPPVEDLARATVALVTSGGIVPKGNPDRIESSSASKFGKCGLEGVTGSTYAQLCPYPRRSAPTGSCLR